MLSSRRLLNDAVVVLNERQTPKHIIAWTLAVDPTTVARVINRTPPPAQRLLQGGKRQDRVPLSVPEQCELIAFYCQSTPLPGMQRWTLRTATKQLNADMSILGRTIHHSTLGRTLIRHHMRPHRLGYFLHIRDPLFIEKMHHILEVYAKCSKYTFCFDECPNIQAISRSGPDVQEDAGRKLEFVYKRNGTTDLFGFLRVSEGTIDAYCRASHETETLIEVFTTHVRAQPSGEQLHYICDNLSPHFNIEFCRTVAELCNVPCPPECKLQTGQQRRQWLQNEDKRIAVHFLPFHGSWLNQVEVWFGLLRRYTLVGSWFPSVDALRAAIESFARTWNEELAHPFDFRYTGEGLENTILRRFTRILRQAPASLEQLDSKFIADMSLLCTRLITHHAHVVDANDWLGLTEAVIDCREDIVEIIQAEPGPIRRPRAQEAFQKLCEQISA